MSLRNKKTILRKIEELKKDRERLPSRTAFGDDNWGRIDKQLEILNLALEKGEEEIMELEDDLEDEIPNESEYSMWEAKRNIVIWLLRR